MSQYNAMYAEASREGRAAANAGLNAGANPYLSRNASVLAEMWHSGWARQMGLPPLAPNADRAATVSAIWAEWDGKNSQVAAAFPDEWARAEARTGRKRRESMRKLRRRFEALAGE